MKFLNCNYLIIYIIRVYFFDRYILYFIMNEIGSGDLIVYFKKKIILGLVYIGFLNN